MFIVYHLGVQALTIANFFIYFEVILFKKKREPGQYANLQQSAQVWALSANHYNNKRVTMNPVELEEAYKDFTENFKQWAPDECIHVNLQLLQNLGLLDNWDMEQTPPEELNQQFHVIEASDKVTLFNNQFAVWIVPQTQAELPSTLIMIAFIRDLKPHLEIVYTTSGVYNTPKYILKVLQHFMTEVLETEETLASIDKEKEA